MKWLNFLHQRRLRLSLKNKTNNEDKKMKRTSTVWRFFQMLPIKDEEKPTCKCKKCGKVYIAAEAYGIGNLKRHLKVCPRKDTTDVGQLILGQNAMSVSSPKFDPATFRESLCATIIMHELPFRFVEYVGIRAIFSYLCLMSLKSLEILLRMIWLRCIRGKKKG